MLAFHTSDNPKGVLAGVKHDLLQDCTWEIYLQPRHVIDSGSVRKEKEDHEKRR